MLISLCTDLSRDEAILSDSISQPCIFLYSLHAHKRLNESKSSLASSPILSKYFRSSLSHQSPVKMNFFRSRSSKPTCSLIAFYENSSPDSRGRYLPEILSYSANKLELDHDYIQILFPLPEESGLVWDAPIIDRNVFDAFRSRKDLRDNLFKSFERMLWFYGFKPNFSDGKLKVQSIIVSSARPEANHPRLSKAIITRNIQESGTQDSIITT